MNSYSKIAKPNINQLIHDHTNLVKKDFVASSRKSKFDN